MVVQTIVANNTSIDKLIHHNGALEIVLDNEHNNDNNMPVW